MSTNVDCPKCGKNLEIPLDLVNEDYLICGACSDEFTNPIKENILIKTSAIKTVEPQKKTNTPKEKGCFIIFFIIAVIFIFSFLRSLKDSTPDYGYNVSQSRFDHSVPCVEKFLKRNYLRDPDSYKSIHWSLVTKREDGNYEVTHSFRARNGFGGMNEETLTFIISSNGERVINYN